ncbi:cellulase family glycosylhydrolase [Algoriphagus aquimarinus]|mgnify:CR=1 FL=1|uniref:cellulase family glycosylhydrolase n=1 Tax=Algoriphagus aquimarinus TaxID=237018 RepID=UPI0030D94FCE
MNFSRLGTIILFFMLVAFQSIAQSNHLVRDENGRHEIPRGFVVNTNDGAGELFYTSDDYLRMVRMGANYQVIRLELGKLSSFQGSQLKPEYLLKLDSLVDLGKDHGIKTVFKMTVYSVKGFSWEDFYLNKNAAQETYVEAWKNIWNRYKNDIAVKGYDLVNEPRKHDMDISYTDLTNNYLVPIYQKIIDEYLKIDQGKLMYCQAIFMNKGDAINHNQYAEITQSIDRENVVFTPHIYQNKKQWIRPTMLRFVKEAELQNGPMLVGEWGYPTLKTTDTSISDQLDYMDYYIHTAHLFDSLGVGTIKAWFSGNRVMQNFLPGGPSTWAIFSDSTGIGTVERKYITDIIARPYPQAIAGNIHTFNYDFSTRILKVSLLTDSNKGTSKFFIGANRHYPDGFTVHIGDELLLIYNPIKKAGLELLKNTGEWEMDNFIWDEIRQQLVILKWPNDQQELTLSIEPGITGKSM